MVVECFWLTPHNRFCLVGAHSPPISFVQGDRAPSRFTSHNPPCFLRPWIIGIDTNQWLTHNRLIRLSNTYFSRIALLHDSNPIHSLNPLQQGCANFASSWSETTHSEDDDTKADARRPLTAESCSPVAMAMAIDGDRWRWRDGMIPSSAKAKGRQRQQQRVCIASTDVSSCFGTQLTHAPATTHDNAHANLAWVRPRPSHRIAAKACVLRAAIEVVVKWFPLPCCCLHFSFSMFSS